MNLQIFQDFASFIIPLTMPALKDWPIARVLNKIITVSKNFSFRLLNNSNSIPLYFLPHHLCLGLASSPAVGSLPDGQVRNPKSATCLTD